MFSGFEELIDRLWSEAEQPCGAGLDVARLFNRPKDELFLGTVKKGGEVEAGLGVRQRGSGPGAHV